MVFGIYRFYSLYVYSIFDSIIFMETKHYKCILCNGIFQGATSNQKVLLKKIQYMNGPSIKTRNVYGFVCKECVTWDKNI